MRMLLFVTAAALLLIRSSVAVFADEAWSLDYHYALLGEPREGTTFFHQPSPSSKASLIYTLSERGVLGAVNPRDGAVVWRQTLSGGVGKANASFLRAGEGQDIVVSGIGNQVAAWTAGEGRLAWNRAVSGALEDVEILELSDSKATPGISDVVVIAGGDQPVVERLDSATGAVKWQHHIEGGDVPHQVSASTTEVFAIVLHKTMLGYLRIKVISLDPVNGRKTDEYTLSSDSELASADTIISVGANSASPIIAWTDASYSVLKVNIIGTKAVSSFNIERHDDRPAESVRLHAPSHANSLAHFLVHYETATSHWADVFHIDLKKSKIEIAYSLPKVAGKGAFATSTSDANVYFTRSTRDEITTLSSASHGLLGRWTISNFGVTAGAEEKVEPVHAVAELSIKADSVSAIRSAVLLSTGDWVLLREGTRVWQRPEVLAGTISATFAIPAAVEDFAHELEIEAHSNPVQAYIHRIHRHIEDLQRLPAVLSSLPQRMLKGFLGTSADGDMASDTFGFHQVVACATENGRIVALDAGNPNRIMWSEQVVNLKPGESWHPQTKSSLGAIEVADHALAGGAVTLNATTGARIPKLPDTSEIYQITTQAVQFSMSDHGLSGSKFDIPNSGSIWSFQLGERERIVSLVPRPVNDPVASIGKVLGDRRVLYKYIDPNVALLATAIDGTSTAHFYVINTVSGAILYSNTHDGVALEEPIPSIASENWFAYSYTAESSEASPKGQQLVVGEMFESLVPNDRGPLTSGANFSSIQSNTEPFTLTHSYQISESISNMAVTETQQGITSRQLLAVLADSKAIVGIPYGVLDPRRPVNRDPSKDEQAEGLTRYSPVLEFDPKWYLNHQREIVGIQDVVTSAALIESTSLVFAYGLDIFGTRLSPSFSFDILGKDFNKFQMLATVAALAVATFVVAPLVTRKQVNTRWQFT